MRAIDSGCLIDEVRKSGKDNFTRQEVIDMLAETPALDVQRNHAPDMDPLDPQTSEKIRKEDNEMLVRLLVSAVGYDYGTNYGSHLWPTFSARTLALWREVTRRMKSTRVYQFDRDGFELELKQEVQQQKDIIERNHSGIDTSWRAGMIRGFHQAMNLIAKYTHSEEFNGANQSEMEV